MYNPRPKSIDRSSLSISSHIVTLKPADLITSGCQSDRCIHRSDLSHIQGSLGFKQAPTPRESASGPQCQLSLPDPEIPGVPPPGPRFPVPAESGPFKLSGNGPFPDSRLGCPTNRRGIGNREIPPNPGETGDPMNSRFPSDVNLGRHRPKTPFHSPPS
jgi:hypothetical protein